MSIVFWAAVLPAVLIVVVGLLLKQFLGSKKAGQIGFGVTVLCSLLPPYFLSLVGGLALQFGSPEDKKKRGALLSKAVIVLTCICWRAALTICFWVSIDLEGLKEFRSKMGTTGRPVCVIANHTSYFDIFIANTMMPLSQVGEIKMIVSSHVLKLPIMGRIATTMGHLAVPFKDTAATSTNFEVDKDKMVKVMEEYEQHLKDGHHCAWFPEGQASKGDCSKLQQFRAGGLGIAVRSDVELWCAVFAGNAVSWPLREPVGGYPAKIAGKIFCVCESSKAFLSADECGKEESDKRIYLANLTQEKSQEILNTLVAKGIPAGDNTRKQKSADDDSAKKK